MNNNIFKFLKQNFVSDPLSIDRLFVSAFVKKNNIAVRNNLLLKKYIYKKKEKDNRANLEIFLETLCVNKIKLDFEDLINLFEFVVSPSDRIVTGAVYTPLYIRNYIINYTFERIPFNQHNFRIADISCGCGGFLFNVTQKLRNNGLSYFEIYSNHIFGLDIQSYSVTRTKILLSLLALSEGEDIREFNFNLFTGDALAFPWDDAIPNFNGFHIIVGNPPYVRLRNLNLETKNLLQNWEVCNTGLTDLYIPFFQIGIENLTENGLLGYITMNTFFKSLNGRSLREYFHRNSFNIKIIDFGAEQVFKSKNTYTCLCFIQNQNQDYVEYSIVEKDNLEEDITFNRINYNNLDSFKGWNLRLNEIVNKIENTGIPFGKIYKTRHGLATLKNNIYIFKPIREDDVFYYRKTKEGIIPIEKEICKSIINSNRLSEGKTIEDILEKIIFPYSNELKPKLISEEQFTTRYPNAYNFLISQRTILDQRDKGHGDYEQWYAFGRTQSLERVQNKLFFPKISNKSPNCVIASDIELYYYNGQAIIGHSIQDLNIIRKIMGTRLFWYYIVNTSKPYSSNYYSLNGNYISNFGICELNEQEKEFILREENKDLLDCFFEKKYDINIE